MKVSSAIAALAGASAVAAAPAPAAEAPPKGRFFNALSARSASPIHLMPLVANNGKIWLGKKTTSYCPEVAEDGGSCPPGDSTNFSFGDGSVFMGAIVPGGQYLYINGRTGALAYTQAHSAATPQGARLAGWDYTKEKSQGSVGSLEWKKPLFACWEKGNKNSGPYQVFAEVNGKDTSNCLGFSAVTTTQKEAAAWQYT